MGASRIKALTDVVRMHHERTHARHSVRGPANMKSTAELVARITPEQQLLLRAVLLDGEPARTAFQEWRAAVVIDDVDGVSQRLLPAPGAAPR